MTIKSIIIGFSNTKFIHVCYKTLKFHISREYMTTKKILDVKQIDTLTHDSLTDASLGPSDPGELVFYAFIFPISASSIEIRKRRNLRLYGSRGAELRLNSPLYKHKA